MKKFFQRALSVFLCVAISASCLMLPTFAANSVFSTIVDLFGGNFVDRFVSDAKNLAGVKSIEDTGFCLVTSYWGAPASHQLQIAYSSMEKLRDDWNINYRPTYGIYLDICKYSDTDMYALRVMSIDETPVQKLLYLSTTDNKMLVSSPDAGEDNSKWIPIQSLRSPYHLLATSDFYAIAADVNGKIRTSGDMQFIFNAAQNRIYADGQGRAYYIWAKDSAIDSGRDTDTIINVDGDGSETTVTVDGDNTQIDIENGTFTAPDGTIQILDGIIYDESTHTYYIDSHDSYTTNVYNYYTYQYYINYTSITYIGYTEQYDKHYEVYYKLPDGRSSADLTAEELEQLNLSIDVINYGRSADDVSLRSLYHFDGDTDDSSYWNYCTSFTWNKGASLTYMDEGTFGGSLYLDETEHDFTLTLPSALSSLDFTLQWRMYQSHTESPQTDSYVKIGGTTVMQFDGSSIKNGSGTALSAMPIGSWNELAITRDSGTLYYYLNGVKIGMVSNVSSFSDKITFHFGSGQQTFKKLDELRILNTALQKGGASYTPTSVPHDTNLTLVLPDSSIPVADEYWRCTSSKENIIPLKGNELCLGYEPDWKAWGRSTARPDFEFFRPALSTDARGDGLDYGKAEYLPGFLRITKLRGGAVSSSWDPEFRSAFRFPIASGLYNAMNAADPAWDGNYVFSIVTTDGSVYSFPFSLPVSASFHKESFKEFDWGYLGLYKTFQDSDFDYCYYWLYVTPKTSIDIVYMELVEGTSTDLTAEKVTSVTAMTPEDLSTPTLAVRSDIPVTIWQIGGVRPSVPTKGQVWALVERQYITSLQIYNGRAWEACDGRIWTGSRWVPYSSYNVITLKDMSDIVDSSSPDKEYIYTETGFWDWWQRSWNAFTSKFFALFGGDSGKDCKHSYTDEIITEATCTDPGQMRRTCSKCGESILEEIPALEHDWNATETVPDHYELPSGTKCPDCGGTEFSSTLEEDTFTCTCGDEDCGKTWTVTGKREYGQTTYTCSRCGETYVESNETGGGLWESLGNFLSDGVRWIGDKLTSLVESLSGLNKIFSDMAEKVKKIAGGFPALFGSFLALMPQDFMAVIWFGIVGVIVLLVYKKWFG